MKPNKSNGGGGIPHRASSPVVRKLAVFVGVVALLTGVLVSATACSCCGTNSSAAGALGTSSTTLQPTPSAAAVQPAATGVQLGGGSKQAGTLTVSLVSSQAPKVGTNAIEAVIADTAGQPVNDATVSYDIDMTNMSHGKNVVPAQLTTDGRYVGQVRFSMGGPWRIIVTVTRPGQQAQTVRFDFSVR